MNDESLPVALLRVAFGVCGVAVLLVAMRVLASLLPAAQIPGLTWGRALAVAGTFTMMGGALVLVRKAVTGRGRSLDLVRGRLARRPVRGTSEYRGVPAARRVAPRRLPDNGGLPG